VFTLEECIKYVKICDTTNPSLFGSGANAFDLDAIEGQYFCKKETAWGAKELGEIPFPGKNWATYFTYTVVQPVLVGTVYIDSKNINGADSNIGLESGESYRFEAMGDWFGATPNFSAKVDAEYMTSDNWTTWSDGNSGATWRGPNQGDLQINNEFVNWGSYSPTHTYYFDYTGTGLTVNFRCFDGMLNTFPPTPVPGWYTDNDGIMTVNIYRLP